jgi:hypothetical protein
MTPPVISAALLYREPNIFPILTPAKENKKVVIPMTVTDFHKSTDKKAKDTPTAKASMLVAIAIISIVLKPVLLHEHSAVGCCPSSADSSSDKASLIILTPMTSNNPNAIQWSKDVIICSNCAPRKYPIIGINAWNPPNHNPHSKAVLRENFFVAKPLQIDTEKASIERATLIASNDIISISEYNFKDFSC